MDLEETYPNFLRLIPLSSTISCVHHKKRFERSCIQTTKIVDRYFFGIIIGDGFRYRNGQDPWYLAQKYDIFLKKGVVASKLEFVQSGSYEFLVFGIEPDALEGLIENREVLDYLHLLETEKKDYKMQANLKIVKKAYDLCVEEKGRLQVLGQLYMLMELIIEQFLQEASGISLDREFTFQEWEIDKLLKVSQEIEEYPERDYSVAGISKKTGISIPRLQTGFKEKHGLTVALFIKESRLEKAEKLLRTSNLNVSEIVCQIGLTSRSYFSKIFKEKYHCTPSEYKNDFPGKET